MNGGGNLPVGPGIWGFIAFFVLAIALWLLVRNMNSRLRRMAYTDRERAQAAEAAARQGEPEGTATMAADVPESSETDVARDQPGDGDSAPRT
ncbi:hypothetical protein FHX52_2102 [Humibacillus xanthopallidus]|uniref:Uncharacterized protein n=1 Tax=Humibacillus xanthopallidus TaxID=412689 RepID=A0A543PXY3_9MICO|nr:hypothetical protein [Humibacillus xanthopallidus]TQN48947.1 hypothetical protein FHX52_2102 [Humibacillus xanthopallidus]